MSNISSKFTVKIAEIVVAVLLAMCSIALMIKSAENRIDWTLVDSENKIMEGYLGKNVHNLYYGAGSWYLNSDNILSYRMYIDDEAKLPNTFIKKIRINSALDVFNDVLNYIDKKEN